MLLQLFQLDLKVFKQVQMKKSYHPFFKTRPYILNSHTNMSMHMQTKDFTMKFSLMEYLELKTYRKYQMELSDKIKHLKILINRSVSKNRKV